MGPPIQAPLRTRMRIEIRLTDRLMQGLLFCRNRSCGLVFNVLETIRIMPERPSAPVNSPDRPAIAVAGDAVRAIRWTALISLGVVFFATILHGLQLRSSSLDDHRQELAVSARSMAMTLNRTLVLTQELLEQTDTLVRNFPDAASPELSIELRQELRDERLISEIAILDARGRVVASSEPRHMGRPTLLTEDVIRQASSAGPTARLLGPFQDDEFSPAGSASTRQAANARTHLVLAVPLQARMRQAELGRLNAIAIIHTDNLLAELRTLATPRTRALSLLPLQGPAIVDSLLTDPTQATEPSAAALWLASAVPGTLVEPMGDGRVWLFHQETLQEFGLMVRARTPLIDIRKGWLRSMAAPIALLLLSIAVVALMTRSALRLARQRVHLQYQLASRNQQLSNVFENAGEGIITIGTDGVVREFNRAAEEMLGVPAELARGRQIGDLLPPDEVRLHRHMFEMYRDHFDTAPAVVRQSFVTRRLDGRPLAVEFSASKYLEGREGRITAIIRDVTQSQAAETRFRALFERSGEPHMLFVGPYPLTITDCNEAAARIYRAESRSALIGMRAAEFALDEPDDPLAATIDRLKDLRDEVHRTGTVQRDMRIRCLDGTKLMVQVTGTMVPLDKNDGLLITLHDLTAREAEAEAVLRARDAAQTAANTKARFLAVMSHELRTPLTGIIGMIELLDESRLDLDQSRHLAALRSSSQSLIAIVNDILDFSRFEAGQVALEAQPFGLQSLIEGVMNTHRQTAINRGNRLIGRFDDLQIDDVIGDALRLRQVLHNLVGNAVKFTEQGDVRIEARSHEEEQGVEIELAVIDTGIGIDQQAAQDLFQPFVQADHSITRNYGGSGLGLAISRQLIQAMGGEIGLHSVPGQGSRFTVRLRLPRAAPALAATPLDPAQPMMLAQPGHTDQPEPDGTTDSSGRNNGPARRLRILVAEDNPVNRLLLQTRLERDGHEVLMAEDGFQAIDLARTKAPDLILMDIQMPRCDGATATRQIRTWSGSLGRVPIWGLSADALPELQEQHLQSGLDGYLTKPIDWPRLRSVLSQVSERRSGYDAPRESPLP